MTDIRVDPDAGRLHLDLPGHPGAVLPLLWLRHSCPTGFHPETGERILDLRDLPDRPGLDAAVVEAGHLVLHWTGGHVSRFALDWLAAHVPGHAAADPADIPRDLWRSGTEIPRHQGPAILSDDQALSHWLCDTKRMGVSIVEDAGTTPEDGMRIARRVGFLRETNFGVTFEVQSKPNPNNLAYTAEALPLHTDLANQELPPGYQFLHCIANAARGGGSVFADGLTLAEDLRAEAPKDFAILTTTPVPFRFFDEETDLRMHRPVIDLWHDGRVKEVSHNAHLVDILDMAPDVLDRFYPAYRRWIARIEDPAYAITLRLEPGEIAVFDNRRVLHGRSAFDPSTGFRHLHGCYVDRGEFDGRLRVLARAETAARNTQRAPADRAEPLSI